MDEDLIVILFETCKNSHVNILPKYLFSWNIINQIFKENYKYRIL